MSLQTIPPMAIPEQPGVVAFVNMVNDASGEKSAFIFQAPKTGNIDRVCFRTVAVTTPTDTDLRLETVDGTTGNPSGTLFGTTTNVTIASASMTANTWIEGTLTLPAAVTKGDMLAIVIAPTGSPNLNIARTTAALGYTAPYSLLFTASYVKSPINPVCAVRYDDTTYPHIPGVWPASALGSQSITSTGSPDEIGNVITMPFKCRVTGLVVDQNTAASAGDLTAKIYDSTGALLISKAYDFTNVQAAGTMLIHFGTTQTLDAGSLYRIAVEATTVTTRAIRYIDVASVALMNALPFGSVCYYTQRTDAGAWTDTTTRRLGLGLIVDQLDDGAGGGGGGTTIFNVME